ncbi:Clavaminate synthase-like protein [Tilletiaria anomala UBC 951]|uniref:Clavaminate synthase-like protein n=1 Tax=Tilletiaria anomala (strain ATCC 24038 / CBS 436.72 / UBC 951) TaxID=1037660 RepID=A0A066VWQ5_TILAU|nr:Clavaminate synthase-like protein [Tilletiaria anomala UBC 951]KDN44723.1 Clavaminate synthase-like protein [Tilletiaria anomala UBC 951]
MPLQQLPVISLRADRDALGSCIREASQETGFFYLTDHGISTDQVSKAFEMTDALFSDRSPEAMEEKLRTQDRINNSGYTALMHEKLDPTKNTAGDLKESFYVKKFASGQPQQPLPSSLQSQADELGLFFESCRLVSLRVLEGFALALGLSHDYFAPHHHAELDRLRLIHYPPAPVTSPDSNGSIRAGSHSDYGSCTLLFQKDVGGLQVDLTNGHGGHWIDVPPKPGCIVVNVADAMEFWSASRFKSTQHRVAMPQNESQTSSRYSIAYFCQPDENARLEPLKEDWRSEIDKTKFASLLHKEGITGGEYLQARLAATY